VEEFVDLQVDGAVKTAVYTIVKWRWECNRTGNNTIRFKNPKWSNGYTGTVVPFNSRGHLMLNDKLIESVKTHRMFFVDNSNQQMAWCDTKILKDHLKRGGDRTIYCDGPPTFMSTSVDSRRSKSYHKASIKG
jgi:NAD(P)H-flavin reductase